MFVPLGPGLFHPFGMAPAWAPAPSASGGFFQEQEQTPGGRRRQHESSFPLRQQPGSTQRRRQGQATTHPAQYHPRYSAGFYPWPTPGRHHHHPAAVYCYADSDASSEEEELDDYDDYTAGQQRAQHAGSSSSHSARSAWSAAAEAEPPCGAWCPHHAHLQLKQQQQQAAAMQAKQQQAAAMQAKQQQQAARAAAAAAEAAAAWAAGAEPWPARPGAKHSSSTMRHVPVHTFRSTQQQQQQPQQQQHAPRRFLSKAEAATTIQSWWRMRRLARQRPALDALMAAAAQLGAVTAKFDACKAEAGTTSTTSTGTSQLARTGGAAAPGFLSHKQFLELQELTMRVLLQLDCTPCGVPELRAVRKRLAARAMSLLDTIQASFSATVAGSMEVPDSVVDEALMQHEAPSKAPSAAPAQQQQQQQQEQEQEQEQEVEAAPSPVRDSSTPALPVRVLLRVAGQCCDAATQTE